MVSADWGRVVYELTTADDTSEMLEDDAMIFVMYQDKEHEDNDAFVQIFEAIAEKNLEHAVTTPLQWFTIDTHEYHSLEDPRDDN